MASDALMECGVSRETVEFKGSNDLYSDLPSSKATRALQAYEDIELAKLEADGGEIDQASKHLVEARNHLPQIVNYFIALHFYQVSAKVQHLKGSKEAKQTALRSAVVASEWGLASSRNERERSIWAREAGQAYRDLAELYWQSNDVEKAVAVWEWYPAAAFRNRP